MLKESADKRKKTVTKLGIAKKGKIVLPTINGPATPDVDTVEISVIETDTVTRAEDGKPQIRFTSQMDLDLLREVYVSKPFIGTYKEVPRKWDQVFHNLKWTKGSVKSIRKRFDVLKLKHRFDDAASLRSSGTEEEYDEKKQLLTEITEMIGSVDKAKEEKSETEKAADEVKNADCEAVREAALTTLVKQGTSKDIRKKESSKGNGDLADIFKQKNLTEQLHLEKQFAFEKEKFGQTMEQQQKDREERAKDRDLESRRLDIQEQAMKNQHEMMLEMLKKFAK